MKRVALKTYGKIVAFLLGIVGFFNGCDIIPNGGIAEYGTPTADFVVKGKVVDKQTQKPVKDMAVIRKAPTAPYGNDTVRTNSEGVYELNFEEITFQAMDATIYASDIDGTKNGEYVGDTIRIPASEFKRIKKGNNRWYNGKFEKTNANFSLSHEVDAMYGVPSAEYKEIENGNK